MSWLINGRAFRMVGVDVAERDVPLQVNRLCFVPVGGVGRIKFSEYWLLVFVELVDCIRAFQWRLLFRFLFPIPFTLQLKDVHLSQQKLLEKFRSLVK